MAILAIVNLLVKVSLELRFHFGPGYRIYFGQIGNTLVLLLCAGVLLLCAGDKTSQTRDIELAKTYWIEYKETHR